MNLAILELQRCAPAQTRCRRVVDWCSAATISFVKFVMRVNMRTRKIVAVAMLVLSTHALAGGQVEGTKGIFSGSRQALCQESPGGFADPPNQVFLDFGNRYADVFNSTITFSGKGTAIEQSQGMTSFMHGVGNPGQWSVGTFLTTCTYTVQWQDLGRFTLSGSCEGSLPTGPAAGSKVRVTNINVDGQIAEGGKTIVLGASDADAQTLELIDASGNVTYTAARLCGGTGVLVRTPRR